MRAPRPRTRLSSTAAILAGGATLASASTALADTFEVTPQDDLEAAINALQPGDELLVGGGTYTLTERFGVDVQGTAAQPIVIRAKDGESPVIHRPAADQNVIDVDDGAYLVFRGLEISGGSHGLRLVSADFVTIEDCEIHDTDDVALSANSGGDYEGLHIRRNHIHHTNNTGEGMYLGCNQDACRVHDSLISDNYIHHTNGPTVIQGDGIELKEGSYGNVIRDNVIHDTLYPCILTYSTAGNGPPNIVERNVLWSCGDHGIQSAADAIIRNNIILGSGSDGLAMQPHQSGSPANLTVVHNTILHPQNHAVRISGISGPVLIANNALYAQSGDALFVNGDATQLTVTGNVGEGAVGGGAMIAPGSLAADFVAASYAGAPPMDVFPKSGSALIGAGDAAHVATDDFNGTPRNGVADAGAYTFDASGNPGWPLGEGFKDAPIGGGGEGNGGGGSSTGGAGSGGADGGANPGAGGSAAGSSAGPEGTAEDDSGCGCRLAASPDRAPTALWALLGLAALALSRRRGARGDRSSRHEKMNQNRRR
jgi:MYXO-CTERM domain-containing protein